MSPTTAICRGCRNYVPVDAALAGSWDDSDHTVRCRECGPVRSDE